MRVLVTGCAGFIGRKVSEFLLGEGHAVVGVDTTRPGELFGFVALTPFEDGLTRTIEWYRSTTHVAR